MYASWGVYGSVGDNYVLVHGVRIARGQTFMRHGHVWIS